MIGKILSSSLSVVARANARGALMARPALVSQQCLQNRQGSYAVDHAHEKTPRQEEEENLGTVDHTQPIPAGSWDEHNAAQQKKYNIFLGGAAAAFLGTILLAAIVNPNIFWVNPPAKGIGKNPPLFSMREMEAQALAAAQAEECDD